MSFHTLRTTYSRPRRHDMTDREREVWALVADGMSNKQIARKLRLSYGTIKCHVSAVFALLEVHNRTQAAVKFRNQSTGATKQ